MSLLATAISVAAALVNKSQISCHKISLFATTLQLFKERWRRLNNLCGFKSLQELLTSLKERRDSKTRNYGLEY